MIRYTQAQGVTPAAAVEMIKARRPHVWPGGPQLAAIQEYHGHLALCHDTPRTPDTVP